jgi:methyltransferase (TIGR00027 family)
MSQAVTVENVSDTALLVALQRAMEGEREDALFRDPYAVELAGERGAALLERMPHVRGQAWAIIVRTQLLDELILDAVERREVDTILNLAAGLDTRPYRLMLPATLRWIEVDFPPLIEYKNAVLRDARAFCRVERVAFDLRDVEARRRLLARIGREGQRVLVITEGLLLYLRDEEVGCLAEDLRAIPAFQYWLSDLASARLVRNLRRRYGGQMAEDQVQFRFGPVEHVEYFRPLGWQPKSFHSLWKAARRLKRRSAGAWLADIAIWLIPGARKQAHIMSGIVELERVPG